MSNNGVHDTHVPSYLADVMMITLLGLAAGSPLSTRPSKIIAGQEPDKTNEFLQLLGRCAAKGANADVVARVKKGEKPVKKSE